VYESRTYISFFYHKLTTLLYRMYRETPNGTIIYYDERGHKHGAPAVIYADGASTTEDYYHGIRHGLCNGLNYNKGTISDINTPVGDRLWCKNGRPVVAKEAYVPTRVTQSDERCSVCCETMTNMVYRTSCGHEYHVLCAQDLFSRQKRCALCRKHLLI
jgi:hypothetical protein